MLILINDIKDQELTAIDLEINGLAVALLIWRAGAHFKIWRNQCPHAGRRLDWAPGKFLFEKGLLVCAAHGAMISLDSGRCVEGPGRGGALTEMSFRIEDQHIYLLLEQLDAD